MLDWVLTMVCSEEDAVLDVDVALNRRLLSKVNRAVVALVVVVTSFIITSII